MNNTYTIQIATTKDQLIDHYLIRLEVFVKEQNISLLDEYDFIEKERIVFIINDGTNPIGTARLKLDKYHSKIERVAILKSYRSKGVGKLLIDYLVNFCEKNFCYHIFLGAQEYAIGFYEKCGFQVYGEMFLDADIPHYNMKKELKK